MRSNIERVLLLVVASLLVVAVLIDAAPASAQIVLPDAGDGADKADDDNQTRRRRTRRSSKKCPEGQVTNADSKGNCCWPGQVWIDDACVGTPSKCPKGHVADVERQACIMPPCHPEMRMVDERHCCWNGQGWSNAQSQCVGKPECPEGLERQGELCVGDTDGDGLLDLADGCKDDPEDRDGFEDDDGCPDPDNDGDGIADAEDVCPNEAGEACPEAAELAARRAAQDDDEEEELVEALPPEDEGPGMSGMELGGWVAIGVGTALVGTGVAMHAVASTTRSDITDAGTTTDVDGVAISEATRQEALDAEAAANTQDTVGVIAWSIGGLAIGAGVVLLMMPESESASVSAFVTPAGDAFVSLGGRF